MVKVLDRAAGDDTIATINESGSRILVQITDQVNPEVAQHVGLLSSESAHECDGDCRYRLRLGKVLHRERRPPICAVVAEASIHRNKDCQFVFVMKLAAVLNAWPCSIPLKPSYTGRSACKRTIP